MVIKLLTISYNGGTGSKILKLFEHTEYTIAINSISRFNFQAFGSFSAIREMMADMMVTKIQRMSANISSAG